MLLKIISLSGSGFINGVSINLSVSGFYKWFGQIVSQSCFIKLMV